MRTTYSAVRLLIVVLLPAAVVQSQQNEQRGEMGTASGMLLRQIWAGPELGKNFGNNATPSPDGRYIAFNELISPGQLEVTTGLGIHDVAAGTNRVITKVDADDVGFIGAIAWAPDGQRLAYQWYSWKASGHRNELRVINLDGSSMRV